MKLLFTILVLLISLTSAHAEEGIIPKLQQYDVDVIIFEDANARYINSEDWAQEEALTAATSEDSNKPEPPENLDTLSIDEINAIDENNKPLFENIKPEILNKEYKRINNSKEYNVLFHGSWRQAGLDVKKAFEINLDELDNTHKPTSENTITGTFELVLARYLHIYSKLNYHRKLNATEQAVENTDTATLPGESTVDKYENFTINNHRRMRSKKLHYIDHPLVGMLIQINPVKPSTEKTTPLKTN